MRSDAQKISTCAETNSSNLSGRRFPVLLGEQRSIWYGLPDSIPWEAISANEGPGSCQSWALARNPGSARRLVTLRVTSGIAGSAILALPTARTIHSDEKTLRTVQDSLVSRLINKSSSADAAFDVRGRLGPAKRTRAFVPVREPAVDGDLQSVHSCQSCRRIACSVINAN